MKQNNNGLVESEQGKFPVCGGICIGPWSSSKGGGDGVPGKGQKAEG